jgi:hypothetical protein
MFQDITMTEYYRWSLCVEMEAVRAGSQARHLAPPWIFEKEMKIGIPSNISPKIIII